MENLVEIKKFIASRILEVTTDYDLTEEIIFKSKAFSELSLDSLDYFELIIEIEDKYGISFSEKDIEENQSALSVCRLIKSKLEN